MATAPKPAGPRYYHKNGKIYDAGIELTDGEIARMERTYPEKMKSNSSAGESNGGIMKTMADFANGILQKDLDEIQKAKADRDAAKAPKKVSDSGEVSDMGA